MSSTGLVHGALVVFIFGHVVYLRSEVHKWHFVIQLSCILLVDALQVSVVASAVHVATIDVDSCIRLFFDLLWLFLFHDRECKRQLIDCNLVLTCVSLQDTSQESLWEVHSRDPVRAWVSFGQPF